ncbi:hypothetical protein [Secundilactobacillus oryzae]|nr:hypothetical protein [Secundilactobacillus oryzae]
MMNDINWQKEKTLILTQTDPNVDVMFKSWLKYGYMRTLYLRIYLNL